MNLKLIASAAGLFGFGLLVGWALTADHYTKEIKDKDQNIDLLRKKLHDATKYGEIKSVQESKFGYVIRGTIYDLKQPDKELIFGDEVPPYDEEWADVDSLEVGDEGTESAVGDSEEGEEEYDEAKTEEIRENLQNLIDTYTDTGSAQDEATARFVESGAAEIVHSFTPPFVIPKETYAWDEEGENYAKITITYYPKERLVLDDEEDKIEDVASMLGWKNLTRFGDGSGDPRIVFIRNRRMETDFEVVMDDFNPVPLHVQYNMGKEEFEAQKAAGFIRLRPEDQ